MTAVHTLLADFERAGGTLTIEAGTVRVCYPETHRDTIAPILASLRQRKQEVIRVLSGTTGKLSASKSILARVIGQNRVAHSENADPCWHCAEPGTCWCVVCGTYNKNLKWRQGRCGACLGTGFLAWGPWAAQGKKGMVQ